MKKIFFLLIALCSVVITSAQQPRRGVTTSDLPPKHVVNTLNEIIREYGNDSTQVYSVNKNPNTNQMESKTHIVNFVAPLEPCDVPMLNIANIASAFTQDEPLSYQILHITPGSNENFSLKVMTDNALKANQLRIRTNKRQEMWMMCTKNPSNPQLRDAYAIVWEKDGDVRAYGSVFMITSLRPDLFERNMESSANTFKIDGRVGHDINDKLYAFFMADSYEELKELRTKVNTYDELKEIDDDPRITYMEVKPDRSFGLSVEIDKRKCGAIRTVMPDGTLCQLWTNVDMVPGETYRITTHNGYFDEDRDYESRVGRYSGKSMIFGHDNDDVEYWENDRVIADTALTFGDEVYATYDVAADNGYTDPIEAMKKLSAKDQAQLCKVLSDLRRQADLIEGRYKGIKKSAEISNLEAMAITPELWYKANDFSFKYIDKHNKLYEKSVDKFIKLLVKMMPAAEVARNMKDLVNELAKQNKIYNELLNKFGCWSKSAIKCQKTITRIIEKYVSQMKEMQNIQ